MRPLGQSLEGVRLARKPCCGLLSLDLERDAVAHRVGPTKIERVLNHPANVAREFQRLTTFPSRRRARNPLEYPLVLDTARPQSAPGNLTPHRSTGSLFVRLCARESLGAQTK